MAKFGYWCKCGWVLRRKDLTRKEYAKRKLAHALGEDSALPCEHLARELAVTAAPELKVKLLQAASYYKEFAAAAQAAKAEIEADGRLA